MTETHAPRCPRFSFSIPEATESRSSSARQCSRCHRELCGELDSYYGFDAMQASMCRDCRKG